MQSRSAWILALVAVAMAFGAFSWVQAGYAHAYDIVMLDTFGRTGGIAYRINNSNQIVGLVNGGPQAAAVVVWDLNDVTGDGITHVINGAFTGGRCPFGVYGINDSGEVVGIYLADCNDLSSQRPFLYQVASHVWVDLGCPGDDPMGEPQQDDQGRWNTGFPLGINNSGQVIGVSREADDVLGGYQITLWSAPGSFVFLGAQRTYSIGWFFDINNQGISAGSYYDPDFQAFRGTSSSLAALSVPAGFQSRSEALGINDSGQIVGYARDDAPAPDYFRDYPVLWNGGYPPVVLETFGYGGWAYDIDSEGDVVGHTGGQATLWTGLDHQPIDLTQYSHTNCVLVRALGINDQGVIVGWARYGIEGVQRPFAAIPRIDEAPPTAHFVNDSPGTSDPYFDLEVIYEDVGVLDETTLDNSDIVVRDPAGTPLATTFVEISERGESVTGSWYWRVTYRLAAPGGAWDEADAGQYQVWLSGGQVCDGADHCAVEAQLGTFTFSAPQIGIWMEKGQVRTGAGALVEERFGMVVDMSVMEGSGIVISDTMLVTPNDQVYHLQSADGLIWTLTVRADDKAGFSDFTDGEYMFKFVIPDFIAEKALWFGIPETSNPLPVPTECPHWIQPLEGAPDVPVTPPFSWTATTDPNVNSIFLEVNDLDSGRTADSVLFTNPTATGWSYMKLLNSHSYEAALSFRHGYYGYVDGPWSISVSKFVANALHFETADADPGSYEPGDLSADSGVTIDDAVILRLYLVHTIVNGEPPFVGPVQAADLNGDGVVNAQDLLLLSRELAEATAS